MNNTVKLKNGIVVPALGQGTWYLGDSKVKKKRRDRSYTDGYRSWYDTYRYGRNVW